ncbi:hypothetical protein TI39_contig912g00001 [Zymoseptoria brevis]|uniref:Major facilitator superfamily (MFS) profile domain-containing protein n=1 Tax=Zymoseptoria brevis TaxID=1047168 RepID=A0A0F4GFY3_9PEZI|nr:hypothetical protein TI39_contig912g00001 [Zymoseptoria brevis]
MFVPIGFLGCNYLYVTEVAPTRLRMPMASFSTANHWLWNFAVLIITPVAIESLGYRYYTLYAILGACIPAMVISSFPETNSRSLEQMETLFRDYDSMFGVVKASLIPQDPEISRLAEATAREEYDNKVFDESETIEKRA